MRQHVRALFSFTVGWEDLPADRPATRDILFREGEPFWSSLFADGHVSIVANSGDGYKVDCLWEPAAAGPHVIGAMTRHHATDYGRALRQAGAYLLPGQARALLGVPAGELTDRIVALEDLWGGSEWEPCDRIECVESALLRRLKSSQPRNNASLSIRSIADEVVGSGGLIRVEDLACAAGVSRQHLTRVFQESVGVTPKLYGRLARFQLALRSVARNGRAEWAQVAAATGYADQSHLIADFRQFSGYTPEAFVSRRFFHPFQNR